MQKRGFSKIIEWFKGSGDVSGPLQVMWSADDKLRCVENSRPLGLWSLACHFHWRCPFAEL